MDVTAITTNDDDKIVSPKQQKQQQEEILSSPDSSCGVPPPPPPMDDVESAGPSPVTASPHNNAAGIAKGLRIARSLDSWHGDERLSWEVEEDDWASEHPTVPDAALERPREMMMRDELLKSNSARFQNVKRNSINASGLKRKSQIQVPTIRVGFRWAKAKAEDLKTLVVAIDAVGRVVCTVSNDQAGALEGTILHSKKKDVQQGEDFENITVRLPALPTNISAVFFLMQPTREKNFASTQVESISLRFLNPSGGEIATYTPTLDFTQQICSLAVAFRQGGGWSVGEFAACGDTSITSFVEAHSNPVLLEILGAEQPRDPTVSVSLSKGENYLLHSCIDHISVKLYWHAVFKLSIAAHIFDKYAEDVMTLTTTNRQGFDGAIRLATKTAAERKTLGSNGGGYEHVELRLSALPSIATTVAFTFSIYEPGDGFARMPPVFLSLFENKTGSKPRLLCQFNVDAPTKSTSIFMGQVSRAGAAWRLQALGSCIYGRRVVDLTRQLQQIIDPIRRLGVVRNENGINADNNNMIITKTEDAIMLPIPVWRRQKFDIEIQVLEMKGLVMTENVARNLYAKLKFGALKLKSSVITSAETAVKFENATFRLQVEMGALVDKEKIQVSIWDSKRIFSHSLGDYSVPLTEILSVGCCDDGHTGCHCDGERWIQLTTNPQIPTVQPGELLITWQSHRACGACF